MYPKFRARVHNLSLQKFLHVHKAVLRVVILATATQQKKLDRTMVPYSVCMFALEYMSMCIVS